ncbi:hypothetical protein C1X64_27915 [Pseudomonas sp. GW456-E7]|nr:hypothetical protein C1X64_27915 [Pseudomonas sp. GW456-E7]
MYLAKRANHLFLSHLATDRDRQRTELLICAQEQGLTRLEFDIRLPVLAFIDWRIIESGVQTMPTWIQAKRRIASRQQRSMKLPIHIDMSDGGVFGWHAQLVINYLALRRSHRLYWTVGLAEHCWSDLRSS